MPETQRAIIDTYQSIVEPPDFWEKRLPSNLDGRTPKVVEISNGGEGWSLDGGSILLPLSNFLLVEVGREASFIQQRLLQAGVITRGMAAFGLKEHLRVTAGLPEENKRFLEALRSELAR